MNILRNFFIIAALFCVGFSCSDKKEILKTDSLSDYYPLELGKSITYRIDSTVFLKSGSLTEVHKYQVKHTVLQETTDNNGNRTYMIGRALNNEAGTGNWTSDGSYAVTLRENSVDVTNDNLTVTVLQLPFKNGFSWKGNSRLPLKPYDQLYDMEIAGNDLQDWVFSYTGFGDTENQGQAYNDVWTVTQNDYTLNIPPTADTKFGYKEVSTEKYAKGIGLVYKDFQLFQYEDGSNHDFPAPHYTGFGITMWMISHN